jgi:hypothetical protein
MAYCKNFQSSVTWPCEIPTDQTYKNLPAGYYKYPYQIMDNKAVELKTVTVHEFSMGDVDDPDLYAAEPLYQWQTSEQGQWIMEHAVETPIWNRVIDPHSFGWRYQIVAKLKAKDYTYWSIKWKKLS